MRRFGLSLICTLVLMLVVAHYSIEGALGAIEKTRSITDAVQVKQLEKIDALTELQDMTVFP